MNSVERDKSLVERIRIGEKIVIMKEKYPHLTLTNIVKGMGYNRNSGMEWVKMYRRQLKLENGKEKQHDKIDRTGNQGMGK